MAQVRGGEGIVLPHVQRFADDCAEATGAQSFGTYVGHDPSRERALDIFVPVSPTTLGDRVAEFALEHQELYAVTYVIWRQRINSGDGRGWRWMADRGSITQNHYDHAHISFKANAPINLEEDDDDMNQTDRDTLAYLTQFAKETKELVGKFDPKGEGDWWRGQAQLHSLVNYSVLVGEEWKKWITQFDPRPIKSYWAGQEIAARKLNTIEDPTPPQPTIPPDAPEAET